METVSVTFQVNVAKRKYDYNSQGEAELSFDVPMDLLNSDMNYSDILYGLFVVARQRYLNQDKEE